MPFNFNSIQGVYHEKWPRLIESFLVGYGESHVDEAVEVKKYLKNGKLDKKLEKLEKALEKIDGLADDVVEALDDAYHLFTSGKEIKSFPQSFTIKEFLEKMKEYVEAQRPYQDI